MKQTDPVKLDYLRVVIPAGSLAVRLDKDTPMEERLHQMALAAGLVPLVGRFQAYGYTGWTCGPLSLARRHDGELLQASGPTSIWLASQPRTRAGRCSRIDLALDVQAGPDTLARQLHDQAEQAEGRQVKVSMVLGAGSGDTLYLGCRSSTRYMRVYDKLRQLGEVVPPEGTIWRYELELKGAAAALAWMQIQAGVPAAQIWQAHAFVLFTKACLGEHCPSAATVEAPMAVQTRTLDLPEKKLHWLATQVGPTVRRLAAVYGRDVIAALLFQEEKDGEA